MPADPRPDGGYGPWNPGIQSELPRRLLPIATIFRPENVFTSIAHAAELHDLTGLPLEELAIFRPERLIVHELLVRVMADISVPDPESAQIDDLGINFRRIVHTILTRYIHPRLPEIAALYASVRARLLEVIEAELAALLPPSRPAPPPRPRGLLGLFRRPAERGTAIRHEDPWDSEERRIAAWTARAAASDDALHRTGCRALARLVTATRSRYGRWWGDQNVLCTLAADLACTASGSRAIGWHIEPLIRQACEAEGYALLAPQQRPVIMNVKGASASGKSTMRPLQRRMAAELGLRWSDFALISPDIWRKYLLDYKSLGEDYKYAGALAGHELAFIDHKLDRYMARKAASSGIPHLLIDRFRFDSFAPESAEAGSNLLTRFGQSIYMFFMITPPHETVVRSWRRGLSVGRYKAVDDLLAHNVEAYAGMPTLFFTWALYSGKSIHFEFLDNSVPLGERPLTVAFGRYAELNVLDVKCILDIDRYRKIDIAATTPEQVYRDAATMAPDRNTAFLTQCVRTIPVVNFADRNTGAIYACFEQGRLVWTDPPLLERALENAETRAGLLAVAPDAARRGPGTGPARILSMDGLHTVGRWREHLSSPAAGVA